jgi:glycogen operon protein
MSDEDWSSGFAKSVGLYLNGAAIPTPDAYGHPIVDNEFLACFNAYWEPIDWTLPDEVWAETWRPVLDTTVGFHDDVDTVRAGQSYVVGARAVVLFERTSDT